MKSISYDIDVIRACANSYRNYATEMNQIKNDVKQAVSDLTSTYWQSKTADKFVKQLGPDWAEKVERFTAHVEELVKIMNQVARTYDSITQEAEKLRPRN